MTTEIRISLEEVEKFLIDELSRKHGIEAALFEFVEVYRDGSGEGPMNTGGPVFFKVITK